MYRPNGGSHAAAPGAVITLALLLSTAFPARAQVHSEFPALTRPFTTESFGTETDELNARLADRGLSMEAAGFRLSRGDVDGGAGARPARGDLGGRLAMQYRHGRYALGGEATEDGRRGIEPREYPARVVAGGAWPEARLFAALVAGFDERGYAGGDLAIEGAPVTVPVPISPAFPVDLRPRLTTWMRLRVPARGGAPLLMPALAMVLDHLPVLASSLVLAPSVQSEWRAGAAPVSVLMLHAGCALGPWPSGSAGGAIRRDSQRSSRLLSSLFVHAAYALPLDHRSRARFLLGVGTDLDVVLRSAWPTSG